MNKNSGIAIVGIDCRYPGADNPKQYWENILSLRQQFRRIPNKRLHLDYYFSDDPSDVDYMYASKAAVLTGYEFDRVKHRVSKSTFEQTDMAHWLALDVAYGALKDAGFKNAEGLNKERTGVILGNSLNGEFTRANMMRLRWPYVFKVLESTLTTLNYSHEEIIKILTSTEKVYKSPFPEPNADTLAGGLSNTIAGRICNYFDFHGGGYTIDGACSSSLLAFGSGCNAILNGELDVALVGGVDLSIDPFETIGFSRNGALAANEMEVYSTKSAGFWPGEGCGIVVLMKEEEAIERELTIYSVIRGWGISSDGSGGITRPKSETQQMAFDRTYEKAGYDIASVAMFEGHGTGTTLGDNIELTALTNSLKQFNKKGKPAFLGSVKQLIGHTKAAAGVAGLIKASLALKNRVIPTSKIGAGVHKILEENHDILQLAREPKLWEEKEPMRASVSSMGFGGINVHLTMEEPLTDQRPKKLPAKTKRLAHSPRDYEVFPIAAGTKKVFLQKIERLIELAQDISRAEFIDLSAAICIAHKNSGAWRAAVVAATPDALYANFQHLAQFVNEGKNRLIDSEKGIFFDASGQAKELAFLFPGQGSPVYQGLGAWDYLCKDLLSMDAGDFCYSGEVADTSVAQPAIVQRSLQSVELLDYFGIEASYAIGHSLGEISALGWAGVFSADTAVEIAKARGTVMSEFGEPGGAMLALQCDLPTVESLIKNHQVNITGYNGKDKYVIGGKEEEISIVQEQALKKEIQNVKLRVSHAFHTPMMNEAASKFRDVLKNLDFNKVDKSVYSTVYGSVIDADVNFLEYLYCQIKQPVKFKQAVENLKDKAKVLIEVGPGSALTKSMAGYDEFDVMSLDFGSASLRGFLNVLSVAFVSGASITFEELNFNRFYREFDIDQWRLHVLENPCEKIEHTSNIIQTIIETAPENSKVEEVQDEIVNYDNSVEGIESYLKQLISEKTELPLESINGDDKIMSELHLNSLSITEIISITTKNFNKNQKVFSVASMKANSDGSIHEISELIFSGESSNGTKPQKEVNFELLPNWTQTFRRLLVPKKASNVTVDHGKGMVRVYGSTGVEVRWEQALANSTISNGNGSIYVYESANGRAALADFLNFLNTPEVRRGKFIMLVNLYSETMTGDLRPVFRSFHLEEPNVMAQYLEIDKRLHGPEDLLIAELKALSDYKEIIYNEKGERMESEIELFIPGTGELTEVIGKDDVILATGGGKGITFESVRELAQHTGAKIGIIGRSFPEQDGELEKNLSRLKAENIQFLYCSADVCETEAVKKAVQRIVTHLGPVKVFIHGAGFNKPKPIHALTPEDFEKTLAVKLQGIKNVVDTLDMKNLNLLIGFGSVIAQSGMQGNADYAWANDQLARYIEGLQTAYPNCRSFTLEWSVWDETGMGVSLNSIEILKQQGVWPIPIKQGIKVLKSVIANQEYRESRLVVMGRYGSIPTMKFAKEKLLLGRFISNVKHYVPGVEIISDVNININDDIYLKNHVFQNQYVFPTVMILEGIAQVFSVLYAEQLPSWHFKKLRINQSIFISAKKSNIVRFVVTRTAPNHFKAVVQSEDSGFEVNCFELNIDLSTSVSFKVEANGLAGLQPLPLDVETRFYDDLLFHHGSFRRIKSFAKIDALESVAKVDTSLDDPWFGPYIPNVCLLGDPGLNDAAIHCHQACRPGFNLLPTRADEIVINPEKVEGPLYIRTTEIQEEGNDTTIDVCILNEQGEVKQYWKNLVLTRVTGTAFSGQWDIHLLAPYIQYELRQLTENRKLKISAEECKSLLHSLKSTESSELLELEGYNIGFTRKTTTNGSDPEAERAWNGSLLFSSELKVLGFDEPIWLSIRQLSYP